MKKENTNITIKDPYLQMLQSIMTSGLPIKKMAQMITALRDLQKHHKEMITNKVAEAINALLTKED